MGALFLRLSHRLLWTDHAGFLYVDDVLFRLLTNVAPLRASLLCLFWVLIGLPISWHKLALSPSITWIGYIVDFRFSCWGFIDEKVQQIAVSYGKSQTQEKTP